MRTLHNLHTIDIGPGQTGVTARNGDKWADALGQTIELCECLDDKHIVVGTAMVSEVWHGNFDQIPARLIEDEHELSSRSYTGLLDLMQRAYGPQFDGSNIITVLRYMRLS